MHVSVLEVEMSKHERWLASDRGKRIVQARPRVQIDYPRRCEMPDVKQVMAIYIDAEKLVYDFDGVVWP